MKERSYLQKGTAVFAAAALSLTLSACTKTSFKPSLATKDPAAPERQTQLVKRTQTDAELALLFDRYHSSAAEDLPRGLQAILRQMVQVPEAAFTETVRTPRQQNAIEDAVAEKDSRKFVDVSNDYLFADKKPLLPLSGGFLNNPATKSIDFPAAPVFEPNTEASIDAVGTRARLQRPSAGLVPAKERIVDAGEKILQEARMALSSAGEAVERGFGRLAGTEQEQEPEQIPERQYEEDPLAEELRADRSDSEQDEESEERIEIAETEAIAPNVVDRSLSNDQRKTDVRKELQSAKEAFLSRFDRSSYSLIRETAVLVTVLLAFILVAWLRLEYEKANRRT